MCLSTVCMDTRNGRTEIMKDVTRLEAEGQGFWLVGLLGEKKFIEGRIQSIDLINDHSIILTDGKS